MVFKCVEKFHLDHILFSMGPSNYLHALLIMNQCKICAYIFIYHMVNYIILSKLYLVVFSNKIKSNYLYHSFSTHHIKLTNNFDTTNSWLIYILCWQKYVNEQRLMQVQTDFHPFYQYTSISLCSSELLRKTLPMTD